MHSRLVQQQFRAARIAGTPLVGVESPDQPATMALLAKDYRDKAPLFRWDCVTHMTMGNAPAEAAMMNIGQDATTLAEATYMAVDALRFATKLPPQSIVFLQNAHRWIDHPEVAQAIANLRDAFKGNERTLVLLAPHFHMPAELRHDVMILDEELPTVQRIGDIVRELYDSIDCPAPTAEAMTRMITLLRGLSEFGVEQTGAMAMTEQGIDLDTLRRLKARAISQIKGLTLEDETYTASDVGGQQEIWDFAASIFAGPRPPTAIVRIDEIEKMIAGSGTSNADNTGTSQDQLAVMLNCMEDFGWTGQIVVGMGGSGKSLYSKALGATYHVPILAADLGSTKASLLGDSEQNIRLLMKTIYGLAGSGAYFVGTCNGLEVIPTPLLRRFHDGIWYFDLPDAQEKEHIWTINGARYGIDVSQDHRPVDTNWTGAEIRNACDLATRTGKSPKEASKYIVPVAISDAEGLDRLRKQAHGKFLSVSYPGAYRTDRTAAATATQKRSFTFTE